MSDAQWVLDIAANLDGSTTHAISELDAITAGFTGAGRKSEAFSQALKIVTGQLDAAKIAAASANDALALGSDQYKTLEREAVKAAKALERADAKGLVPVALHQEAQRANAALTGYSSTLKKLEGDSARATAEQKKYEQQLKNVEKIAGHVDARNATAVQRYSKLAEASAVLPGPLGRYIGVAARSAKANEELTNTFGAGTARTLMFAAGAVVATTALALLTVAVVAGVAAWTAYVAVTADTARSAGLTREAFAALSSDTSSAVASFDEVSAATGLGDKELIALTKSLKTAKVAAGDMPAALLAAATAEAALGAGGSSEFISRLQSGELAVDAFASEVDEKFGGVVAKRLRGLDALGAKLKKSWAGLFANVNLEPVLDAFGILVGMFDKANPLAQAMAFGIEKAFGVVADNAVGAAYAVEAFALDIGIAALKAYIFVKENADKIKNAFIALGVTLGLAGAAWAVFNAGAIAGFAATAASAVVAGASIAAAWLVAAAPALIFIAAIAAVGVAIYQLITYWDEVVEGVQLIWTDLTDWFKGLDMAQIGIDLIMGLVNGIGSAQDYVIEAVTGAVGKAITAAKDVLGISSPSKVFAEIGDDTAAGYSQGVERSTPEAQGSMAALVEPTAARSASASGSSSSSAPAGSSGGRGGFDLSGATFNFYGVADAESAVQRLDDMLTGLLERDAESMGGAVPA